MRLAALCLALSLPFSARAEVPRRAADERLLLTPAEQTRARGNVLVSDDEGLLVRVGVGVSDRVQLDLWAGGFPLATAGVLPVNGLFGGGAAGVVGFLDLGVKVRLLDEDGLRPGLALGYDLLDGFGVGIGAGAAVAGGGAGAAVGLAGVNAQFNIFSAVAGEHFGDTHVTLGLRVLDNHNFLPQSAGFVVGGAASGGASGSTSESARLDHLPTRVQGWAGVEQVLGEHSALMAEVFPATTLAESELTTGARWILFSRAHIGPFALEHVKLRLDLAAIWIAVPDPKDATRTTVGALPWAGLGVYFM